MPSKDLPLVIADGPLSSDVVELLNGNVELLPWTVAQDEGAGISPEERRHLRDLAAAIYTYGHLSVDGAMMDRLPGLKIISNFGVGVDHIDVAAAVKRNIPVGNTPDVLNGATADMAFALLLAAGRRLAEGDRYARSSQFTDYDPGYMLGREIHGAVLGILGLGRIGEEVARRAEGFGMRILYHNRRKRATTQSNWNAEYVSFEELLKQSDYVVVSTPLTDQTRGMIDRDAFQQMKRTAIFVNIARGAVVDTDALTQALRNNWIYAAAVDVTDPEPLPRDHPLLNLDNLTITPHLGSATVQTRRRMAEISVENLLAGLAGRPLAFAVK